MQLGDTIEQVRNERYKGGEFSRRTAFLLALHSFDALSELHRLGFVHRDVRPGSFCVQSTRPARVLVTNLGLARRWRCPKTRMHL